MEDTKQNKEVKNSPAFDSVRVRPQSKIRFNQLLWNVNTKDSGRKVVADNLFALMLDRISTRDLQELQRRSLTNEDRVEMLSRTYIKVRGHISKDDFLGFTLSTEFPNFLQQHGSGIVPAATGDV